MHLQGLKAIAAALPEAKSLHQLLLRNTGVTEEGAAALAAALKKPPPAAAAVDAASPRAGSRRHRSSSSSSSSYVPDHVCVKIPHIDQDLQSAEQSAVVTSPLEVLDLSHNTVCDTGAAALVEAIQAGACPSLTLLNLESNRYPFDWSTILNLQQLEVKQTGLRIQLGAPSSWCLNPSQAPAAATAAAVFSDSAASSSSNSSDLGSSIASEDLCGVCLDAPNTLVIRDCSHRLCTGCYKQLIKAASGSSSSSSRQQLHQGRAAAGSGAACPFCRQPMSGFIYSAWVQDDCTTA